jgi:hypothetical protein
MMPLGFGVGYAAYWILKRLIYPGTFVGYYLQKVIYYDFPIWVFAIVYTVFVALVLVTWII